MEKERAQRSFVYFVSMRTTPQNETISRAVTTQRPEGFCTSAAGYNDDFLKKTARGGSGAALSQVPTCRGGWGPVLWRALREQCALL